MKRKEIEKELLESPAVIAEMRRQWDAKGEPDAGAKRIGRRVRVSLQRHIGERGVPVMRELRCWRRYGIAASILLVAAVGAGIIIGRDALARVGAEYYVYHSGNQDKVTIGLSDGTEVTLGARSKIVYPKEFKGNNRTVEMEGQAYFEVASDVNRPFIVKTASLDVTALGTAFEVFEEEGLSFTEVMLAEGKVRVDFPADKAMESYTMVPGQKLSHSAADKSVSLSMEDPERYSAWKDMAGLAFVRERVSNILPRLEKWFGCTIECSTPEILNETFTFRVRTESPEVIFGNMDCTLKIRYSYDPESNTYTIHPRTKR